MCDTCCREGSITLSLNANVFTVQVVNKFGSLADIAEDLLLMHFRTVGVHEGRQAGNYYSYMRISTDSERQNFARKEKALKK